jgi:2,4-dichlorophenol 6-monooxygenase
MGDAVHRHPPSNGLGSNTSIQDAWNLAWKLAFVLKGQAGVSLLESYDRERSPVAKQIVTRANQSIGEFGPIFDALGLLSTKDPDEMKANMAKLKDNNPTAARQREALRKAIEFKSYEFNCHGVELNQRYESGAIVPDGSPLPEWRRDRELYYQASTRPGAHLPHVWVYDEHYREVSTLDIVGKGRFTVLTGIGGEAWVEAARAVAAETGLDIVAHVIGPSRDYADFTGDWARTREIEEGGCLLVRPDQFIAYREFHPADDAEARLRAALSAVLGRAL